MLHCPEFGGFGASCALPSCVAAVSPLRRRESSPSCESHNCTNAFVQHLAAALVRPPSQIPAGILAWFGILAWQTLQSTTRMDRKGRHSGYLLSHGAWRGGRPTSAHCQALLSVGAKATCVTPAPMYRYHPVAPNTANSWPTSTKFGPIATCRHIDQHQPMFCRISASGASVVGSASSASG